MAASPRVQLSLKGRLLSEVAFVGSQLRIGRMRENDVVVNNLAVSRFHATLRREGDALILEDLGSENGTQLNGERVSGSVPVGADDVIQLGKYELRVVLESGPQLASAPPKQPSDAWDASQTFLALGPVPAERGAPRAQPAIPAAELLPEAASSVAAPDPDGVFAFGDDELAASAEPETDARDIETDPMTPSLEHTALFDFGADAAPLHAPTPPQRAPANANPKLYAGLIVQRDGKLHALRAWEDGELCAGRSPECELVLADAGVSRRHALFSRGPNGYEVRDLESVNGVYVNGQRSKRHTLAVGDVVRVESFELTFVLDHQPIGNEVSGPTPAAPAAYDGARATQFSLEVPGQEGDDEAIELAPLASDLAEPEFESDLTQFPDNTESFEILPVGDDPLSGAQGAREAEMLSLPESDLMHDASVDEADEKDATLQGVLVTPASIAAPLTTAGASSAPLVLKFALDATRLSARAREALAVLEEEGALLPALLSIQRA